MKKNLLGSIIYISILVINTTFFSSLIYRSYIKLQKINSEEKVLQEKIAQAEAKIDAYKEKIKMMEDEFEREKIARNRLQMIKENEEIYRFINKEKN